MNLCNYIFLGNQMLRKYKIKHGRNQLVQNKKVKCVIK